ncbi:hypothetical protein PRUPE_2G047700 [Prunus persica]|uniref:DNA-directed RNA polymerase RBP11-like dimerisation domain-containing protein n=1 Tax=Prunus persica TaxID=3760 RepID=A0A251QB25_PRUPE|nr:hypothetical protein PRUPE_2G047700 [Prunus persica]
MEHGSLTDPSQSTFSLLYNPRTKFCGYSIPHPSDNRVNIRIQTTGAVLDAQRNSCLIGTLQNCGLSVTSNGVFT